MKPVQIDPRLSTLGDLDIARIDNIASDCQPGSLFFAMPGTRHDGSQFIADAKSRGAVAVVATAVNELLPTVVVSPHEIRELLSACSAAIVGHPEADLRIIAVTGTNGKTSVTHFVRDMCVALGQPATVIGTLTHQRTTPAAPELYRTLAEIRDRLGPTSVVAIEVSSHALDQGRTIGLVADVAIFTNLSHDHLDYHETMEKYFAAKAVLFTPQYSRRGVAVDSPWGRQLEAEAHVPMSMVSGHDFSELSVGWNSISGVWRGQRFSASVGGWVNVENLAAAMAATSLALSVPDADVAAAVASILAVPGRYELVHRGPDVVVDYAHTPDGLRQLLRDARTMTSGRIIVVFGCGGDRDPHKRPIMGAIAHEWADVVIVTNDNPRGEDPSDIAAQIVGQLPPGSVIVELDRRAAIARAIATATSIDVVIIAGKGHESTQTIGESVASFSDVATVREILESAC
jgi:UDP-N-acetylmuramoyl-L-alanyl-D-glutamate--2,6-diaminopimelate ligase